MLDIIIVSKLTLGRVPAGGIRESVSDEEVVV